MKSIDEISRLSAEDLERISLDESIPVPEELSARVQAAIRKLTPSGELPDDLPGKEPPDEELIRKESLGSLLRAMDSLPDSQRKLMRLHVLQGRSYEEIAALTGLSPLNIRVQVSLARKKLKSHEVH